MASRRRVVLLVLTVVAVVAIAGILLTRLPSSPSPSAGTLPPSPPPSPSPCKESKGSGFARCIEANVTRIIDGDTIDVSGGLRIRLVLVDAPELGDAGGPGAKAYLESLCRDAPALIDEDDYQVGEDPYGRVLAVAYCDGTNANGAMINSGHAETYYTYCSSSEFGSEAWTGCSSPPPQPPTNCDAAYPDVCIPPPPPDLDCSDISYHNFRVLAPDPHRFDGDGDGIGCEGG